MYLVALNRLISMGGGFHLLRHHILIIPVSGISGTIPAQDQGFTTALCD
jgi:uncharacterized protein GlcG (DUF336 family)